MVEICMLEYYYGGAYVISNQSPRWTPKPCISPGLHTKLGSDYHSSMLPRDNVKTDTVLTLPGRVVHLSTHDKEIPITGQLH